MPSPCNVCIEGKIKVGKKNTTDCPSCRGTNECVEAFDVKGKLILPGELVKLLPRPLLGTDGKLLYANGCGNPLTTQGYVGKVLTVYRDAKDNILVSIIALPNMMSSGEKTVNHGFHVSKPEYVKIIKDTSNSKRLKQVKEKKGK